MRERFHLNIDGLGWIEAIRVLARNEPDLLRKLLVVAQDRFPFDKPNLELATTEDDIRHLPDVPDSALERVFVEDFRGRQLLRITCVFTPEPRGIRSPFARGHRAPSTAAGGAGGSRSPAPLRRVEPGSASLEKQQRPKATCAFGLWIN
jgi:hypothetical protein